MTYKKDRYLCEDVDDFACGLTLLILGVAGHGILQDGECRVIVGTSRGCPAVQPLKITRYGVNSHTAFNVATVLRTPYATLACQATSAPEL